MTGRLDLEALDHLLRWVQSGVVARRQILEIGGDDNDIARLVRRRVLTPAHTGVYVDHTGRLTRRQQQWAAVLSLWPAALTLDSALPEPREAAIHVAVDIDRRPRGLDRVRVHRTPDFGARVNWRTSPPRIHLEHAAIDVASRSIGAGDVAGAYARLAEVCHRHTTPGRVAAALATRKRVPGRAIVLGMLDDLREGACSVLERGYLEHVERAHGLPRPNRQRASTATGRSTRQDVRYERFGVIVELDGRAFHEAPVARDGDAKRDLAELARSDAVTARVTYGLVYRQPCWTAGEIAALLRRNGWTGTLRRCPRCAPDPRR